MAKIIDGPARGQQLELKMCPDFLRVVRTPDMLWVGLDRPKATAIKNGAVVAYRIVDPKARTPDAAEYTIANPQPSQDEMRNNALWFRWIAAQQKDQ